MQKSNASCAIATRLQESVRDQIYMDGISPAAEQVGLQPIRADSDFSVGLMHRALFERIAKADVVIADLTTANPHVFYELGVRHAVRPNLTVVVADSNEPIPMDVSLIRFVAYDSVTGMLSESAGKDFRVRLSSVLRDGLINSTRIDSPVFQLLGHLDYRAPFSTGLSATATLSLDALGSPDSPRQPLVFLSYAREDKDDALGSMKNSGAGTLMSGSIGGRYLPERSGSLRSTPRFAGRTLCSSASRKNR